MFIRRSTQRPQSASTDSFHKQLQGEDHEKASLTALVVLGTAGLFAEKQNSGVRKSYVRVGAAFWAGVQRNHRKARCRISTSNEHDFTRTCNFVSSIVELKSSYNSRRFLCFSAHPSSGARFSSA
jgi:hypothetical protein